MVDILKNKFSWDKFDEWRVGYPRLEDDDNNDQCYSFSFYLFGKGKVDFFSFKFIYRFIIEKVFPGSDCDYRNVSHLRTLNNLLLVKNRGNVVKNRGNIG